MQMGEAGRLAPSPAFLLDVASTADVPNNCPPCCGLHRPPRPLSSAPGGSSAVARVVRWPTEPNILQRGRTWAPRGQPFQSPMPRGPRPSPLPSSPASKWQKAGRLPPPPGSPRCPARIQALVRQAGNNPQRKMASRPELLHWERKTGQKTKPKNPGNLGTSSLLFPGSQSVRKLLSLGTVGWPVGVGAISFLPGTGTAFQGTWAGCRHTRAPSCRLWRCRYWHQQSPLSG